MIHRRNPQGVEMTMEPRFRNCDRDTLFLMPPSVDDWVPENHLARFVVDIVARLDLSPIQNAYAGRGSDAYLPSILWYPCFFMPTQQGYFPAGKSNGRLTIRWPFAILPSTHTLITTTSPPSAGD